MMLDYLQSANQEALLTCLLASPSDVPINAFTYDCLLLCYNKVYETISTWNITFRAI